MNKALFVATVALAIALFADTEYPHVQDNGGGYKSNASYRSCASIGQAVIGYATTASYRSAAGFVSAPCVCLEIEDKPGVCILPAEPTIGVPYPNPFNSVCQIDIALPEPGNVQFEVFDLAGHKIFEQAEKRDAGAYTVKLDATNLPSGAYLYRIAVGAVRCDGRLILVE